jgi:hypothetical protein
MNSFLDRVLHRARGEVPPSVLPRRRSAFEPSAGEGSGVGVWRLGAAAGQGLPGDPGHGHPANGDPPGDPGSVLSGDPPGPEGGSGRPDPGEGSSRRLGLLGPRAIPVPGATEASPRSPLGSLPGPVPGQHDSPGAGGRDGDGASSPFPGRKALLRPSGSGDREGATSQADSPSLPGAGSRRGDAPEGVGSTGRKGPADGPGFLVPRADEASVGLRSLRIRPARAAAIQGLPSLQGPDMALPGPQGRGDDAMDSRGSPGRNGDTRGDHSPGDVGHEPPAPVVQVTIGRIEVRAPAQSSPPAHPPRPAPVPEPTAGPRLGLEDYLQQRIRGER